jgi:hypothetical protein
MTPHTCVYVTVWAGRHTYVGYTCMGHTALWLGLSVFWATLAMLDRL